jgi:hypothetical protein
MRKFLGLLIVAVLSVSATTTAAQALTSSTTGGYAYNSSTQSMYSCDTLDDGATFENQSWNADNQRGVIRDNAGGSCNGLSYAREQVRFRGCRDQVFDNCGPLRYP